MDREPSSEGSEIFPGVPHYASPHFEALFRGADPETRSVATALRDEGYAVVDFQLQNFDRVAAELIEALEPHFHGNELLNVWRPDWSWNPANRLVHTIASSERMISLLSRVFGRRAFPFQTLNFRIGSCKRGHSDSAHFSSHPERFMCGVYVALEDVSEGSGPLFYYPGSHKLPILTNAQLGLQAPVDARGFTRFEDAWQSIVEAEGFEKRRFLAKRGQAVIWSANLIHGGEPIEDSDATRQTQVTHYFFHDCLYWTPLHSDPMRGEIIFREPLDISRVL